MIDRILMRMPEQFEYLLPAIAVAQNYISQQIFMWHQKHKATEPRFTIEFGEESQMFLNSMFPRMEVTVRENPFLDRSDWDNVLDFRDIQRAFNVSKATGKHITEGWSAMFGASAPKLPILGPIGVTCQAPTYHFVIDAALECAEELKTAINVHNIHWGMMAKVAKFHDQRVFQQFTELADARVYIGLRSGASYLAATMMKGCIEIWNDTLPYWFMNKPQSDGYRVLLGATPSRDIILDEVRQVAPLLIRKEAA